MKSKEGEETQAFLDVVLFSPLNPSPFIAKGPLLRLWQLSIVQLCYVSGANKKAVGYLGEWLSDPPVALGVALSVLVVFTKLLL